MNVLQPLVKHIASGVLAVRTASSLAPLQGDQLMRAVHVAAFALSSYACTEGRVQKPFNPLLGETFEAEYPDKGWRFIAEKVTSAYPLCNSTVQEVYCLCSVLP